MLYRASPLTVNALELDGKRSLIKMSFAASSAFLKDKIKATSVKGPYLVQCDVTVLNAFFATTY